MDGNSGKMAVALSISPEGHRRDELEQSQIGRTYHKQETNGMAKTLCAIVMALLLTTARLLAHHAFAAEYDVNKLVSVSGAVTAFNWTNPHAWLYVAVKDARGKVTSWGFEMGSPGGLMRRGWKRDDLKKGDRVTVTGYRAKDGSNVANARTVTMPDGRKLFGGFQETPGNPFKQDLRGR